MCVLIHTGKNTPKLIENNFAFSPMPNHTIIIGIIATGARERKKFNNGLKDLSIMLILPVNKPTDIPNKLPSNNPLKSLKMLDLMSKINCPEFHSSTNAENTFVGGGNKVMFT